MGERRTLWELSDRNRSVRRGVLTRFLVLWTVTVAVPTGIAFDTIRYLRSSGAPPHLADYVLAGVATVGIATLLGALYVNRVIRHGESRLLARLGAVPLPREGYPDTRDAAYAVAVAAGLPRPPRLYVLPMPHSLNALVIGLTPETASLVVTEGLASRAPRETQEAIFASLVCRYREGDVSWTTLLTALTQPVWAVEKLFYLAIGGIEHDITPRQVVLVVAGVALLPVTLLLLWVYLMARIFLASYHGAFRELALSADVEGLALIRSPEQMIAALKAVYAEDHFLPYGEEVYWLAYASGNELHGYWTEERHVRLEQLRSHLGEPVVDMIQPGKLDPARPEVPNPVTSRLNDPEVVARRERMRETREMIERERALREEGAEMPAFPEDWWK